MQAMGAIVPSGSLEWLWRRVGASGPETGATEAEGASMSALLPEEDMPLQRWIVFPQFHARGVISLVLESVVGVWAFGASQPDFDSAPAISHRPASFRSF